MATSSCKCHLLLALLASMYVVPLVQAEGTSFESWQTYWNKKLPRVEAPANLAGLSSRMSEEEVVFHVDKIRQGSVHTKPSLCHPQAMLCGEKASNGPKVCVSPYYYEYGQGRCAGHVTTQEGLFFRPDELTSGSKLVYPALNNNLQGRTFLSAQLAAVMPFKRDKLATYMALLQVPQGSNMAASMDDTLAFCSSKPPDGELRTCHSSIESMLNSATLHLGSDVVAMSVKESSSKSEDVHVIRHVMVSSVGKASVTCHDLMFPYLVYGCHTMQSSNVYDVELQRASGSTFHGIAVCHDDTSSWNAAHAAFVSLHARPGDGAICHWLPQNNFVWV